MMTWRGYSCRRPYLGNEPNFCGTTKRVNQHIPKQLPDFNPPKQLGSFWVRLGSFPPEIGFELAIQ